MTTIIYEREAEKDRIKCKIDILRVIGDSGVKLEKRGNLYWARCPFHDEKTPSFSVDQTRQTFRCFGACGDGGDVFTWLMMHDKLTFTEALERAAEISGIPLTRWQKGEKSNLSRMHEVLEAARGYFMQNLPSASDYITKRGLAEETCVKWELGLAPDSWNGLRDFMLENNFGLEELLFLGLVSRKSQAQEGSENPRDYYDYFRKRLMFPIYDHRGKLVGFAGRAIDNETQAKYLNSREGPLFHKRELLFGINQVLKNITRGGKIIVTEGYIDVISAHQAGITNVVAAAGTALTRDQASLLSRYTKDVTLMMDGDKAGINAGKKGAKVLFGVGLSPRLCILPGGKDLDDLVRESREPQSSLDSIEEMDITGFHLSAYALEHQEKKISADDRYAILEEVVECLRAESDIARKIIWISETAKRLEIPPNAVEEMYLQKLDSFRHGKKTEEGNDVGALFLAGLLAAPAEYRRSFFDIPPEVFSSTPGLMELYEIIREESGHNGAVQLQFPLKERSEQGDFARVQELEEAFGYLRSIFERRKLEHFPHEVVSLLSRPLPRNVDMCARMLRSNIHLDRMAMLVDKMFWEYCRGNQEGVMEIENNLESLLKNGS